MSTLKAKYIKTEDNDIVVFSPALEHSDFKHLNPKSAGFIRFFINMEGENDCVCYGSSFSLGIGVEETDTFAAKAQIL